MNNAPSYTVGESDTRPWGRWEVLEVGTEDTGSGMEEYCIKKITVIPNGVLSLQSHKLRREEWTVMEGELEVTLDETIIILHKGEKIHIPLGGVHRMANRNDCDVIVKEIQRGICREDDIIRYEDIYGRV